MIFMFFFGGSLVEERRPSVTELANQKGVVQRASGWKINMLASELEALVCKNLPLSIIKLIRLGYIVCAVPNVLHS